MTNGVTLLHSVSADRLASLNHNNDPWCNPPPLRFGGQAGNTKS